MSDCHMTGLVTCNLSKKGKEYTCFKIKICKVECMIVY